MNWGVNQLKDIIGRFFIHNGRIKALNLINKDINTGSTSVYEVIRVVDGIPLFLDEHLDRLDSSCKLLGSSYLFNRSELIGDIKKLISSNEFYNKNFKILLSDIQVNTPNLLLYFIESNYPSTDLYLNGVHCILYKAERNNPNAKVVVSSFRENINQSLKSENAYEAILVNQSNEVTEGSRSNIFVVRDNNLLTPPANEVLKGITRKRIIDLCNKLNIPITEERIPMSFLEDIDGIFMTGTSPKILPITSIDDMAFNSNIHPLILRLIDEYNLMISDYINNFSF